MKHSDFHSKLWVYRITWRMVGMNWVCPNMKELQSFLAIFIGSHDVQQRFFFLTQSQMWGWVEWSILGSVGPLVPTIRWGMLCWSWGWLMVIEHEDEKRELPCAKRGWTWLKTQHDALSIIEACLIFLELPGLHWLLLVHGVAWFMDDKVPGMAPGKGSILLVPPKLPCHGEVCPKQEGSGSPPTPLPLKLYLERPPRMQDFFRRLAQPLNWNRSFPYTSILCRKAHRRGEFFLPHPHILGHRPTFLAKGYILVLLKVSLGCI